MAKVIMDPNEIGLFSHQLVTIMMAIEVQIDTYDTAVEQMGEFWKDEGYKNLKQQWDKGKEKIATLRETCLHYQEHLLQKKIVQGEEYLNLGRHSDDFW